jgi:translation initiation factor 2B subunit (eIF-2B alpha/beta/delta family)
VETWLDSLPSEAQRAVIAFSDPHPHGSRARSLYAATALYEVARAWPRDQAGLEGALHQLAEHLLTVGQGTAHQPGVRNMITYMLSADCEGPSDIVAATLLSRLDDAKRAVSTGSTAMSAAGAALLHDGDRVLVHDFADRSTQAVVTAAAGQGKRLHVIATACRSRRADGLRVAKEAARVGHLATVVTDAGVGWVIGHYGVKAALVGADAVMGDGTLMTTPGALTVAMVGTDSGVPVHAVTDLWKLMDAIRPEIQEINEDPDPDGVPEALSWAEEGYGFLNPLVDIVPGKYLTSYITEFGEVDPASVGKVAREKYGFGNPYAAPTPATRAHATGAAE